MTTKNGRRTSAVYCSRAVMLAAVWTAMVFIGCADAAESNDWRPCRAAGHRRYDEDVILKNYGGGGPKYDDFTGGGGGDGDGGDDDGETDPDLDDGGGGDDDDDGYIRIPVDDKPKRGASKSYEKKPDLHRAAAPPSYAADAASGNGMRVDTTLLRGETIELPTYVNVPVTLRCRFEPVVGTEDKFDTVVEAMYPGHRDSPPPAPGSHASRILKQLMGSVDGWRGVAHNSARSVRGASGHWFGRREWPDRDDEVSGNSPMVQRDDANDQVAWNILARQRAVKRMRRIQESSQDFEWPERFHGQSARLLHQRFGGHPVAEQKLSKNRLIEDQEAEEVYDQQVDGQQAEQGYDQQVDGRQAEQGYDQQVDGRQAERGYDQQVDGRQAEQGYDQQVDGRQAEQGYDQQVEPQIDNSQQVESVDDSQQIESIDDSQKIESVVDSQQVERVDNQMQIDRVEDRSAVEEVDDRQMQGGNLPNKKQQLLQRDMTATTMPEIATAGISTFPKFRKGMPVRTFAEQAYTTDSTL